MHIGEAIYKGVTAVTKAWTDYRKKEFRDARSAARIRHEMLRGHSRTRSIKEICEEVMAEAYHKASGGGRLPTAARQIMYQARPMILQRTTKELGKDFDQYFTQQLLPDYLMRHATKTADWDVVFDARGHLWEPHTGREIQLGTLNVRGYLETAMKAKAPIPDGPDMLSFRYPTAGPINRYRDVLFIEKEGFMTLLQRARIAQRFDLAIMSTKGLASTAARSLMEGLPAVRFLVLHDFDKAGFSIAGTLHRDTWRYRFTTPPEVVDLGLRLEDVKAEGLLAEPVWYKERNPRANLRQNGATDQEIEFLVTGPRRGQRVELNAFASDQFIAWLERKLVRHGVRKVIPDDKTLATAYRRASYIKSVNEALEKAHVVARRVAENVNAPRGLRGQVNGLLKKNPELGWDDAVAQIAERQRKEAPRSHGNRTVRRHRKVPMP